MISKKIIEHNEQQKSKIKIKISVSINLLLTLFILKFISFFVAVQRDKLNEKVQSDLVSTNHNSLKTKNHNHLLRFEQIAVIFLLFSSI